MSIGRKIIKASNFANAQLIADDGPTTYSKAEPLLDDAIDRLEAAFEYELEENPKFFDDVNIFYFDLKFHNMTREAAWDSAFETLQEICSIGKASYGVEIFYDVISADAVGAKADAVKQALDEFEFEVANINTNYYTKAGAVTIGTVENILIYFEGEIDRYQEDYDDGEREYTRSEINAMRRAYNKDAKLLLSKYSPDTIVVLTGLDPMTVGTADINIAYDILQKRGIIE